MATIAMTFLGAMISFIMTLAMAQWSLGGDLEGTGPIFGKAVDTPGLIIAGTDPVAADCIGARLLGFLPQAVNYLYMLYKDNLGEAEPQKMTCKL